ncbi:DoxX family protein [Stenotrophomonas indicatrix]|uniref:DoxX family protein n=1 Tax=Stenotrophomonas indicatrix TaxID=2045451 RepID=UPI000FDA5EDD|nr:DoxX family protein [Stenotrophomonas indicatrix]
MSTIATSAVPSTTSVARNSAELLGRILLVALFLISGLGKITAYDATAGYMAAMGVPGIALPAVIALEVLGSVAIILGFQTRLVAAVLAGFTLATGVIFHNNFADQMQMIMFLKNVSIAGAFLMILANGAGAFSIDAKSAK